MKIDFNKKLKDFYKPSGKVPAIIKVPEMQYLEIRGEGFPDKHSDFQETFPALYSVAYTLKFLFKGKRAPKGWKDWTMTPPEALWWMKGNKPFDKNQKKNWRWAVILMVPDFITNDLVKQVKKIVKEKKNPTLLPKLKLTTLKEGMCVTMMHVGSYDDVGCTLNVMETFAEEHGYKFAGKHHEIYLTRPNVKPEKTKTALRMPIIKK